MKMTHFRHPGSDLQASTRADGFTLIELMVTITIAGILLGIGVPSLRGFVAGQRVKTASYDISSVLTYARSEALKRNADVVITPNTGGWQNGWSVVAGTSTLNQHEAFSGLTISGPTGNATYASNGRLKAAVTGFNISASGTTGIPSRCVSVSLSGVPSSSKGGC